jgi:ribosomal protein L29
MKEFKNKTAKELSTILADKRQALRSFRFSVAGSNTRNVKEGNVLKKDIARILTVLNRTSK